MQLNYVFLILLIIPAIVAAFTADLLRAAIALLFCSLGLTMTMFNLEAPLAGVFELSVCAGLITVLFVNAISMMPPETSEEKSLRFKSHHSRFILLPILLVVIVGAAWLNRNYFINALTINKIVDQLSTGQVLWEQRGLDLIGQIVMMLAGVFGVVVLFRRGNPHE